MNHHLSLGASSFILALAAASVASAQAPATDWTGPYVGAQIGYGMESDNDVETTGQAPINVTNVSGGARPGNVELEPNGFLGGAHAGYNWQSGHIVYGAETDLSYTDIEDSRNVVTTPLSGIGSLNNRFEQSLDYLGTVRGRLGYAFDRSMIYATGGLAYGGIDNQVDLFGPAGQLQFTGSRDKVQFGYAVGGGVEHAIDENWRATFGYLYYDLGRDTANVAVIPGSGGGGSGYDSSFKTDGHILNVGFNYRF